MLAATIQHELLPSADAFRLLLHYPDTPLADSISEVAFARRHGEPGDWEFDGPAWLPVDESELRALLDGELPGDLLEVTDAEAARLSEVRDRRRREDERWTAGERASFQVIELQHLPPTDDVDPTAPDADWPTVVDVATSILDDGVDPLDQRAVRRAIEAVRLPALEAGLLASPFRDAIVAAPGDESFTNGRHRTAAMRDAGVAACVINTRAGQRTA